MPDFRGVTDENFGQRSPESDAKAIDAGSKALHLMQMPEWRDIAQDWHNAAAVALDRRHQAAPAELRTIRMEAAALDGLDRFLADAVEEARWIASNPIQEQKPKRGQRPGDLPMMDEEALLSIALAKQRVTGGRQWTDDTAKEAVRMGEAAKRVADHPAWKWLMARLSALMWAYDQALKGGYAIDDSACQAAIRSLTIPLEHLAQRLRLGLEARAFLDGTTRDRQEPSNG